MDAVEKKLVQQANAALNEVRIRRALDARLMKAMLSAGVRDYNGGETPVERAIRYFEGPELSVVHKEGFDEGYAKAMDELGLTQEDCGP